MSDLQQELINIVIVDHLLKPKHMLQDVSFSVDKFCITVVLGTSNVIYNVIHNLQN